MVTLSALLLENGLPNLPVLLIEPHRNQGRVWRIKFSYETAEPLSMSSDQALTMVSGLHCIGKPTWPMRSTARLNVRRTTQCEIPRSIAASSSNSGRSAWPRASKRATGNPRNPKRRRSRRLPRRRAKRPQDGNRASVLARRNSCRGWRKHGSTVHPQLPLTLDDRYWSR